jgi:hypothetical protein
MANELSDNEIAELWRQYKPLHGKDPAADLVVALIHKLVTGNSAWLSLTAIGKIA